MDDPALDIRAHGEDHFGLHQPQCSQKMQQRCVPVPVKSLLGDAQVLEKHVQVPEPSAHA